MSAVTEDAPLAGERVAGVRRRSVRKRFAVLSVAALAVLGAALGISFTADTGVTTLSTTAVSAGGATGDFVYTTDYTTATTNFPTAVASSTWLLSGTTTAKSPGWTPVANQAGSVTAAGDIAFVDASSKTTSSPYLLVTVYITNLSALSQAYGSFAWPIRVYQAASVDTANTKVVWPSLPATALVDENGINTAATYLTNTQGYETFKLPANATTHTNGNGNGTNYYEITMDTGGSYFTQSTSVAADLTPSFYITATPSS